MGTGAGAEAGAEAGAGAISPFTLLCVCPSVTLETELRLS